MTLTEPFAKNIIRKRLKGEDYRADKLSGTNKAQLDSLEIEWVELRNTHGFRKFKMVFEHLEIPHTNCLSNNIDKALIPIFKEIFA